MFLLSGSASLAVAHAGFIPRVPFVLERVSQSDNNNNTNSSDRLRHDHHDHRRHSRRGQLRLDNVMKNILVRPHECGLSLRSRLESPLFNPGESLFEFPMSSSFFGEGAFCPPVLPAIIHLDTYTSQQVVVRVAESEAASVCFQALA